MEEKPAISDCYSLHDRHPGYCILAQADDDLRDYHRKLPGVFTIDLLS